MRWCPPVLVVLVPLTLAACGTGPGSGSGAPAPRGTPAQIETGGGGVPYQVELVREDNHVSAVIPAPPDAVWKQLVRVYEEIGLPPTDLSEYDPGQRRIGVADHRTARLAGDRLSLLLNCGHAMGTPREDRGDVEVDLSTRLSGEGEGTLVVTRFAGQLGRRGSMCASRGRLEQEIVSRLLERLREAPGAFRR